MVFPREPLLTAPKPDVMDWYEGNDGATTGLPRIQCSGLLKPEVLVFEGGGTKGIHYAGALRCLEEAGYLEGVRYFAGTSAGAQTAAMVAFGYTGKELEAVMHSIRWSDLLDGSSGVCGCNCCCSCCGVGCCKGCLRLCSSQGFYKGQWLQDFLDARFAEKRANKQTKCTFQELYDERNVELRLGVCNLTTRRFEYMDRHSHPDLSVAAAVRASSAIPFVFLPQFIGDSVYVDGMLQGNLPVAAFPGRRVLAFHLANNTEDRPVPRTRSLSSYLSDILDMLMNSAQRKHGINFDTFVIDEGSIATTPFDPLVDILIVDCGTHGVMETRLTTPEIEEMLQTGREAARCHLSALTRKRASGTPSYTRRSFQFHSFPEPGRAGELTNERSEPQPEPQGYKDMHDEDSLSRRATADTEDASTLDVPPALHFDNLGDFLRANRLHDAMHVIELALQSKQSDNGLVALRTLQNELMGQSATDSQPA